MANRSRAPHADLEIQPGSEPNRALRLAQPYRVVGYVVLLFEFAQRGAWLSMLLLSGGLAVVNGLQRHPGWPAWCARGSERLLLIQGAEALLLAALIWVLPLAPALLFSASLLLANGALGGVRCLSLAAGAVLVAAVLTGVRQDAEAHLLSVAPIENGVSALPGLLALTPAVALLGFYGISFSMLGYGRVRRLKQRQRQQQVRLLEQRARAERLQCYLPQSLAEHLASPAQGTRQRCWLLIAYIDLCDFTPLTARLEADALAEVIDGYLTRIHKLAAATDGIVAKVLGDGVLLFWRPRRLNEHGRRRAAQQALQFAQALPRQLEELSDYWQARGEPLRLAARAALTSGYCTLGDWGATVGSDLQRLEYTVIGTPVNLAARLQTLGAPGGIVVDERTRLLLGSQAVFDAGRVVTVRGLGDQRIFELGPEGQRSLALVR